MSAGDPVEDLAELAEVLAHVEARLGERIEGELDPDLRAAIIELGERLRQVTERSRRIRREGPS